MAKAGMNNIFKDMDFRKIPMQHTGTGEAAVAFLNTPSTEYDEDGQYFVRLRFKKNSAECKRLIKIIDDARDAAFKQAEELLETPKEKKGLKMAEPSYKDEEDDDGNETGFVTFNFKRKAVRKTKQGELKPVNIPFFNALLEPITDKENLEIWSGSLMAISFRLIPFYTATVGVGVSQRLEAVQLLKVVSGGERKPEDYGFSKEENYADEVKEEAVAEGEAVAGSDDEDAGAEPSDIDGGDY